MLAMSFFERFHSKLLKPTQIDGADEWFVRGRVHIDQVDTLPLKI